LDFGTLLAATQRNSPSVIQVRCQDVLPNAIGGLVMRSIRRCQVVSGRRRIADGRFGAPTNPLLTDLRFTCGRTIYKSPQSTSHRAALFSPVAFGSRLSSALQTSDPFPIASQPIVA
jgi:hypothetical protein